MGLFSSSISSVRKVFSDTFNRVDQTGLGTAADGTIWETVISGWNITSQKASASNAQYPMSVVTTPSSDVSISLYDVTQGSSAALWVTDSGNWFAVGIDQEPTNCNCVATSYTCLAWNYLNNCANSYNVGGNAYCEYAYNVAGTCSQYYNPPAYCALYQFTGGGNCSSWTRSGGNCYYYLGGGTCRAYAGGNCRSYAGGNCRSYGGGNCVGYNPYNSRNKTGGNCRGYNPRFCSSYNSIFCSSYNAINCSSYNAPYCAGWSPISYPCDAWNVRNKSCVEYYNPPAYCVAKNSPYSVCQTTAWNYFYNVCTGSSGGSCQSGIVATESCQTCYPQYIRLLQSVGSTVTEIANWTVGAIVKSLRVKTKGSQITVQAFSDSSHISQIGGDIVYTPTGVSVQPKFGITVQPSSANQGYTIDQVEISRN